MNIKHPYFNSSLNMNVESIRMNEFLNLMQTHHTSISNPHAFFPLSLLFFSFFAFHLFEWNIHFGGHLFGKDVKQTNKQQFISSLSCKKKKWFIGIYRCWCVITHTYIYVVRKKGKKEKKCELNVCDWIAQKVKSKCVISRKVKRK